jgi:hypothetical protein
MDTQEYIDKRNQLLKEGRYAEVEELYKYLIKC